jgi:hypothetical protein
LPKHFISAASKCTVAWYSLKLAINTHKPVENIGCINPQT